MYLVSLSFVTFLCLINYVLCVDLQHASSSARTSMPSKSSHITHHSRSYSYSYSYSFSRSRSHSHSHSVSHYKTYVNHAPMFNHDHRQIKKRNIIDFYKGLTNPKDNIENARASVSQPSSSFYSQLNSISAIPSSFSAASVVSHNHNNRLAKIVHASEGFRDPGPSHHSAATHAPISSRQIRGNSHKVPLLSSLP